MVKLAKVCRVVNASIVGVARNEPAKIPWPADFTLYRGGALPKQHRSFFAPGVKFRAPRYTATSTKRDVAEEFVGKNSSPYEQNGVLWVVKIDRMYKCKHVNYLDKISSCKGEAEFLFPAYSPFEVLEVTPPTSAVPYTMITLKAAVDGKHEPEDLPLSPWS